MEIRVAPGWNNPDNHDSKYTLREVKYLINQVAAVLGISPASRDLPPRVAHLCQVMCEWKLSCLPYKRHPSALERRPETTYSD
jgi:hypothetical protein